MDSHRRKRPKPSNVVSTGFRRDRIPELRQQALSRGGLPQLPACPYLPNASIIGVVSRSCDCTQGSAKRATIGLNELNAVGAPIPHAFFARLQSA